MIDKLKYWCHKILPLVYEDSLSYYEVLCKVTAKLNEIIETTNNIDVIIDEEVKNYFEGEQIKKDLKEIINSFILNVKTPPAELLPAVGDGVTNDTESIAALINYASENNKMLYFPEGVYKVDGINIKNVTIKGADRYSTTIYASGGNSNPVILTNDNNVGIYDITIDGNANSQIEHIDCVHLNGGNYHLSNVILKNGYVLLNANITEKCDISNVVFGKAIAKHIEVMGDSVVVNNCEFDDVSTLDGVCSIDNSTNGSIFSNCILDITNNTAIINSGNNCKFDITIKNNVEIIADTGANNTVIANGKLYIIKNNKIVLDSDNPISFGDFKMWKGSFASPDFKTVDVNSRNGDTHYLVADLVPDDFVFSNSPKSNDIDVRRKFHFYNSFAEDNYNICQGITETETTYILAMYSGGLSDNSIKLKEISKTTGEVIRSNIVVMYHAAGITYDKDNGKIYGSDCFDRNNTYLNTISVINYSTFEKEGSIDVGSATQGVAYDGDTGWLWIRFGGNRIRAIDTTTHNVTKEITLDVPDHIGNTIQGIAYYKGYIYEMHYNCNSIAVYDVHNGKCTMVYTLPDFGNSYFALGETEDISVNEKGEFSFATIGLIKQEATNYYWCDIYNFNPFKNVYTQLSEKIVTTPVINGSTIYVDGSYSGNDSDGTEGKPFKLLQDAINMSIAIPYQVIIKIKAGEYEAVCYNLNNFIRFVKNGDGVVTINDVNVYGCTGIITFENINIKKKSATYGLRATYSKCFIINCTGDDVYINSFADLSMIQSTLPITCAGGGSSINVTAGYDTRNITLITNGSVKCNHPIKLTNDINLVNNGTANLSSSVVPYNYLVELTVNEKQKFFILSGGSGVQEVTCNDFSESKIATYYMEISFNNGVVTTGNSYKIKSDGTISTVTNAAEFSLKNVYWMM